MEYITIPDSVTEMEINAYDNGIIYINGWAVGCASKDSNLIFESGTRGIVNYVFTGNKDIKSIVIPEILL